MVQPNAPVEIYQLHILLLQINPPIWRRLCANERFLYDSMSMILVICGNIRSASFNAWRPRVWSQLPFVSPL